jgi:hypothetical protein
VLTDTPEIVRNLCLTEHRYRRGRGAAYRPNRHIVDTSAQKSPQQNAKPRSTASVNRRGRRDDTALVMITHEGVDWHEVEAVLRRRWPEVVVEELEQETPSVAMLSADAADLGRCRRGVEPLRIRGHAQEGSAGRLARHRWSGWTGANRSSHGVGSGFVRRRGSSRRNLPCHAVRLVPSPWEAALLETVSES